MRLTKDFFKRIFPGKSTADLRTKDGKSDLPPSPDLKREEKEIFETGDQDNLTTLVIGIDFGTAFSKVVVGDGPRHWAIPFSLQQEQPYLFPGILTESHGIVEINGRGTTKTDNIKFRIIENDISPEVKHKASAYLALVLQQTRSFLEKTKTGLSAKMTPEWFINVGLPTDSYQHTELRELYREITHVAWAASFSKSPLTLELVKTLYQTAVSDWDNVISNLEDIDKENIGVFPEFVAQLTGYVWSDQRENGVHVLLDVGSGTTDCSAFNIGQKEGDNEFEILSKSVKPFGVRYLQRKRKECPKAKDWMPELLEDQPEDKVYAERLGIQLSDLMKFDKDFFHLVFTQLGDAMKGSKEGGKVATGPEVGVPIFLCGGGSKCQFYKNIVNDFIFVGKKTGTWKIYQKRIEMPKELEASHLKDGDYDRLSVAYGLSLYPLNIGNVIDAQLKKEKKDPAPKATWEDVFVSKDQM